MNPFRKFGVAYGAKVDARLGIDSTEDRIIAELGPAPKFDPVGNPEHGDIAATLADRSTIAELKEDVTREEDALTNHAPPFLYTLGLIAAFGVEFVGSVLLMKALAVEEGERLPLASALTLAIVGVTAIVAHRTSSRKKEGEREGFLKRFAVTLVILVVYIGLATAITVVRLEGSNEEGASQLEVIAQAILMVATAVGPAWCVEWLIRKRAPSVALRKRLSTLRKRLRQAERAYARAREAVNRIGREGARWQVEASRQRALYGVQHKVTSAKEKKP